MQKTSVWSISRLMSADNIFIALGGNLGNPQQSFDQACRALAPEVTVLAVSRLYRTKPYGVSDQPDFLNAAIRVSTQLSPHALLHKLQQVELAVGKRVLCKNGPRLIDLDLLFYRDQIIDEPAFTLPHPRIHQRDFVLLPLLDLAPHYQHPLLGKTIAELEQTLPHRYFTGTILPWAPSP